LTELHLNHALWQDKLVFNGKTIAEIIEDYPYLETEDIQQSLMYAAWLAREEVYPIVSEKAVG